MGAYQGSGMGGRSGPPNMFGAGGSARGGFGGAGGPGFGPRPPSAWTPQNVVTFDDAQRNAMGQGLTATGQSQGNNYANTGLFAGSGFNPAQTEDQAMVRRNAWAQAQQNGATGSFGRDFAGGMYNQPGGIAPPLHGDPRTMNQGLMTGGRTPGIWGDPRLMRGR